MENLHAAFDLAQPDAVFHLAAQAFVPRALEAPAETYKTNVTGTANVLQALREHTERSKRKVRLVFVSSAEIYGAQPQSAMPIVESCAPSPANPYAASKAAAEALVLGEVRSFGVDAVITRAFNHIGPGQNERFAVPSFAAQLAAIASGGEPVLLVGNLEAKRDFLDVRDVVGAYAALAERGESGQTYNVCSGTAVSMREILAELDSHRSRARGSARRSGANAPRRRAGDIWRQRETARANGVGAGDSAAPHVAGRVPAGANERGVMDRRDDDVKAFVFKNRGALLAIPAVLLAAFGKPSALERYARSAHRVRGRAAALLGGRLLGRDDARRLRRCARTGDRGSVRARAQSAVRPAISLPQPVSRSRSQAETRSVSARS